MEKNLIEKVFIINLEKSKNRWKHMKKQMKNSNITNYERIDACYGKDLDSSKYDEERSWIDENIYKKAKLPYREMHSQHNLGSLGCYISHLKTWKKIVEENISCALILEDDIDTENQKMNDIENVLINAPKNWDILIIGPYINISQIKNVYSKNNIHYIKLKQWVYLNSYIVTKSICEKLIKIAIPIQFQVDWFLGFHSNELSIYGLREPLFRMNSIATISNIIHTPLEINYKKIVSYQNKQRTKTTIMIITVSIIIVISIVMISINLFAYKYLK